MALVPMEYDGGGVDHFFKQINIPANSTTSFTIPSAQFGVFIFTFESADTGCVYWAAQNTVCRRIAGLDGSSYLSVSNSNRVVSLQNLKTWPMRAYVMSVEEIA